MEVADRLDVGEHGVDLDGDLGLELDEVDMGAVQGARLSGGVAQAIDESVDKGAAAGMIAAGVPGDEAGDDGLARGEHRIGIEPAPQQGQGEARPQVRQHALEGRRGPADEVDQAALAGGDAVLKAAALLREPLERMAPGGGNVHRIETRSPEAGHGGQHLGVGKVGLGVLREVAAQRLDALALDARDLDACIREPMGDGEPAHAGGLHHRLHGVGVAEPGGGAGNEGIEGRRVVPKAQRRAERPPVLEDLGDVIAANGEIDADGSVGHREAPWLGKNRAPLAQSGPSSVAAAPGEAAPPQSCYTCPVGAAGWG